MRYGFEGFKNFIRCWGERTMKIKEILESFSKIPEEDEVSNEPTHFTSEEIEYKEPTEPKPNIIAAATKEIEADKYLVNNPVSFYCLNLPSIMNGNINLWAGGRNSVGLQDPMNRRCRKSVFTSPPAFDDGKLEFATFDSLLYYILNYSNSIIQDEGPFEFKFIRDDDIMTYLNIDGEFYKLFNVSRITIHKGTKLVKNGSLRVLVNSRGNIFD